MIVFSTVLQKFKAKGEKSGWTYITILASQANELMPNTRTSFRVKGKIDKLAIKQAALLPMGEGDFILPVNAEMRKGIGKAVGEKVKVAFEVDKSDFIFSEDFLVCLEDEPKALETFKKQPPSHQKYFSKWIDSAKTTETKTKRIAQSIQGLAMGFNYGEMIRYFKGKKM
jgi:hypothetical protein